jgi:hypothetical protein
MLTIFGSIGSGSVPVIPSAVGVVEEVDVVTEVEAWVVLEAKARSKGPANRTRSRTNARFRAACLHMNKSPFPAQMCAGRRLEIVGTETDLFVELVAYEQRRDDSCRLISYLDRVSEPFTVQGSRQGNLYRSF